MHWTIRMLHFMSQHFETLILATPVSVFHLYKDVQHRGYS